MSLSDGVRLRAYRKARILQGLAQRGLAGIVLFNPVNIRYACDARNMQVYGLHNPCRYVFVGADGHISLFDFRNCEHLPAHLESVDEVRPAKAWYHMAVGDTAARSVQLFAGEIADLVRAHGKGQHSLAYDRLDPAGFAALQAQGVAAVDGLALMDFARMVKSSEEIACMREATWPVSWVCTACRPPMCPASPSRPCGRCWSMPMPNSAVNGWKRVC